MDIPKQLKILTRFLITYTIVFLAKLKYHITLYKLKKLSISKKNQKAEIIIWNDIWSVVKVPYDLQYDFVKHRGPTYAPALKKSYEDYYSFLLNINYEMKYPIISDQEFLKLIYYSPLGLYINKKNKDVDMIDFFVMLYVKIFTGFYDIRKIEIEYKTQNIIFYTKNNTRIDSKHAAYNMAKLNAVICISFYIPTIGHSWVHFSFPCVVSAICYNSVPRDSVLYKILSVHTRFTLSINNQALRIQHATRVKNNLKSRLDPIKPLPATGSTFIFLNSRKVLEFYENEGRFHCPPELREDIPYCEVLLLYYREVRKFIEDMKPYIEVSLLSNFILELTPYFPVVKHFDPYDVLATIIWQTSVLHSSDHYTFYHRFKLFGGTAFSKRIADCGPQTRIQDVIIPMYLCKFRNFLEMFVKFTYFPEFNNSMANLNYHFDKKPQIDAQNEFIANLKKLENTLIQENRLLCPLENMAQSICF